MLQGNVVVVVAICCCCILTICYKINDQANIRKFMIVAGNITASPDSLGRAQRVNGPRKPYRTEEATTHGFGERWPYSMPPSMYPLLVLVLSSSLLSIRCDSNPIQYTMAEECPCKWKLLGN